MKIVIKTGNSSSSKMFQFMMEKFYSHKILSSMSPFKLAQLRLSIQAKDIAVTGHVAEGEPSKN